MYTMCKFVLTNHFSQANERIAIKVAQDGLRPGMLKVKVKVKGLIDD